ncbi:hypothetical protein [Thioclava sp.]|uniref:hypothetical protein n=1 Tax=Thioclava sp. TaxID=1933450 RepID=UPI003AA8501A
MNSSGNRNKASAGADFNHAETASMEDVLNWLTTTRPYADKEIKKYEREIVRAAEVMNLNHLKDVSADPAMFEVARAKNQVAPACFRTHNAFVRWTMLMSTLLNKFSGATDAARERRGRDDNWSKLLNFTRQHVGEGTGRTPHMLISICVLADAARKAGRGPEAVTDEWIAEICDAETLRRGHSFLLACRNLNQFAKLNPNIHALLPKAPLPNSMPPRRATQGFIPAVIAEQVERLVCDSGCGVYDRIEEIWNESAALETLGVRRAALKKYLGTAFAHEILPETCSHISEAFNVIVFDQVMRIWFCETDRALKICPRTMSHYVGILIAFGRQQDLQVEFMEQSLRSNGTLKLGKKQTQLMSPSAQAFCVRLLRDRKSEMLFRSMHLRFREQAMEMIKDESDTNKYRQHQIIRLGVLAAYAAIALWGVPLRINNMVKLRHLGPSPSMIIPKRASQQFQLCIPAREVKNHVDVQARIADGPTRGGETVKWYLDEIRPLIPWTNKSDFLFPGFEGEQIADQTVRDWLQRYSRDLGLPMKPHNFRHGLASLWLRSQPGDYVGAARLLCNSPAVVRKHYAWIDQEAEILKVQAELARQAGFRDAG